MSCIVHLTVTLQLELADQLDRSGFYDDLESTLRSGLGDVLARSRDCVTVVAAHDPQQTISWSTNLTPLLKPAGEIAVVWTPEEVLTLRPDLTRWQAVAVLEFCERHHDAGDGINWHCVDDAAGRGHKDTP